MVILAYTMYNLIYAFASPILGKSSDKLGRKAVLISGLVVFALVYIGYGFAHYTWQIWALFAVYGLYNAATDGVGKAFIIDLVSPEIRGGAVGLLNGVAGVATLVASIVAGLLWKEVGLWAAFSYGALGAIVSAVYLSSIRVPALKDGPSVVG
jgi:MFS family permease